MNNHFLNIISAKKAFLRLFFWIFFGLPACQEAPKIEGFQHQSWKENRGSCQNSREEQGEILYQQRQKIYQLNQRQVLALLGKPDIREPYQRGQLFYVYLLEKSTYCSSTKEKKGEKKRVKALILRITAIDKVVEVTLDQYTLAQ